MSNRQNCYDITIVLLRLGLSEVPEDLHNLKGTILNLCVAFNLTTNFVRYLYVWNIP